ncbi:UbiD family decarboxylase [Zavarzinella formosa]|uniref:UbiD family decarboxylase n=1 Tax=Zavarzinella formosa TaxID=360055 RepID=UPI0002DA621E|nr:UbiD family decarboxylase [Zavarzinella formosa]
MGHRNLQNCVDDLRRHGQLAEINAEIDPQLEMAEIQRRAYAAKAPALLFNRVRGCAFPMLANLYGTLERTRFLFRDTLDIVERMVRLKIDPAEALRKPWKHLGLLPAALHTLPKFRRSGPVMSHRTTLRELPQLKCWPDDGGAFVTLPLVYTEDPRRPGWRKSNLGMYRVQLSGNEYAPDAECGLHYQIHRGIGVHHAAAIERGERLPVNVIVGGPPALTLSAVMPLPEGLPELIFAGALGGRRVAMIRGDRTTNGLPIPAEADFCISGWINPHETKPEGPFGDHLGYYSLTHQFPLMRVDAVHHRPDAIWPFTVVGRPPQEDTSFGELIHQLTGDAIPAVLPGVKAVHAVDAAGVHPLLLAIGSERYAPYEQRTRPRELLTQANAILGQGQLSLAKYLLIVARQDNPDLNIHHIDEFLRHLLERIDWTTDLHFQTQTTIDTLDYSAGMGLNAGSKVVWAAVGPKRRELGHSLPSEINLADGFTDPKVVLPGIVAIQGPPNRQVRNSGEYPDDLRRLTDSIERQSTLWNGFPLITVVDDSAFAARTLNNWLWMTFTRSDPASDIVGAFPQMFRKHWGCRGPLVIDARLKPHHAPPLIEDPAVSRRVDELASRGGPLHGLI